MSGNLSSFLGESKIFKNEEILSPEYLPDILPHREQQIKQLANNLLPAAKGKKPQNTFIFGPPGTGKSASAKYVFREFENYSGIKTVYLNCWDFNTAVAVLSEIVIALGFPVQRRGWAKDEILSRLIEALSKMNKGLIVCLDEVDQLIYKEQEALYDLLRINQYVKNPLGLILISNNPHIFAKLEPRILSSLAVEEMEFKPYTLQEMKDILQERVINAFRSVEDGVVILAANHAVQKGGDVRVGLQCLLKAGRLAEQENSDKLKVEHVKRVLPQVWQVKKAILKERVSDTEKIILEILGKNKRMRSDELYQKYCESVENPVSDKTFRNCIDHLVELKLLEINKKRVDGNVRIISKV
jgi:cell division control protein 6